MANTYQIIEGNKISFPEKVSFTGSIQELIIQTDWTDDDIENIVKLRVGEAYHGPWSEDAFVRRMK